MRKSRIVQTIWLLVILTAFLPMKTNAQKTIYNSPYVSFSPDGKAWTTNSGDRNTVWYEYGRTVYTGIQSTARTPGQGEHTYINTDNAMVPIGYWKVAFPGGHCVHGGGLPSDYQYHDLDFRVVSCMNSFYSGWLGYCADCGEAVLYGLVYMSETTARSGRFRVLLSVPSLQESGTGLQLYASLHQGFEKQIPCHLPGECARCVRDNAREHPHI